MEETTDVTEKWLRTGLLRGVPARELQKVARRLDAALGRQIRMQDLLALDVELLAMEREGVFRRSMNSRPFPR